MKTCTRERAASSRPGTPGILIQLLPLSEPRPIIVTSTSFTLSELPSLLYARDITAPQPAPIIPKAPGPRPVISGFVTTLFGRRRKVDSAELRELEEELRVAGERAERRRMEAAARAE